MLKKKLKSNKGFTLAELIIVVAIIGILIGVGAAFINTNDFSYVEANRNAETIATAAQNRLTELRNAGGIDNLQVMGVTYVSSGDSVGGYRYIFSHDTEGNKNPQMSYVLPFGSIDQELTDGFYAIGIQTDTGMVGEVFFSKKPFEKNTADYLISLTSDESKRESKNIGYYQGAVDDMQIAFAQLPTPQLTITNYENFSLDIYLPKVKELVEQGKNMAIRVSLVDEDDKALKEYTLDETAIYRTYEYNDDGFDQDFYGISMGVKYTIILDTPDNTINDSEISGELSTIGFVSTLKGKFEAWAKKTSAYPKYLLLGDNAKIYVTVFAIDEEENIDPTFMPRSASVTFCSWFETYKDGKATIACGRHLQNLGKLTEIDKSQANNLPKYTIDSAGNYVYSDYSRGKAYLYTYSGENIDEKYKYRDDVKKIKSAEQVKAIDFDCEEWINGKDNKKIPFTPINLPAEFTYYGNYLTIKHLYVEAPFYAGLFGYAYHHSLYDILIVNPHVVSHVDRAIAEAYEMGAGALIGTSRNSDEIYNCQVYMEAEDGKYNSDDYRIESECYVGGLIGFCEDESIRQNSASVYTGYKSDSGKTSKYVGGLLGCITGDSDIKRSYAAGYLTGDYVGGLVGVVMEDSDSAGDDYVIEGCYSAGHIESASESAAGLIGSIEEQGGYTKSAMRVKGNYCAIIYGVSEDDGISYKWVSTMKTADGIIVPVPIYGTFEGDGFEWLYSSDLGYFTGSFNDLFGGYNMFFGADFEDDNQNYYIPQKDIEYSNSDYYNSVKSSAEAVLTTLGSADKSDKEALIATLEECRDVIRRQKLLQTLDKIDYEMNSLIEDLKAESSLDADGNLYNACDKDKGGEDLYLAAKHAEFTNTASTYEGTVKVNVLSALKAIYNGEGIEGGQITYENGVITADKYEKGTSGKLINYTFRGLYELAKKALEDNDKEQITRIFGKDSDWKKGLFGKYYDRLLYYLFDHIKDYYENKSDSIGEQMYRYYRSRRIKGKIGYYLNSMATSTDDLEAQLQHIKSGKLDMAKKHLEVILEFSKSDSSYWNEWEHVDSNGNKTYDGMKPFKNTVYDMATTAKKDLEELIKALDGVTASPAPTTSPEEMQNAITKAYDSYNNLYHYFDDDIKRIVKTEDGSEVKVYVKDMHGATLNVQKKSNSTVRDEFSSKVFDKYTGTDKDMRGIRDALDDLRGYFKLTGIGLNAGVESAVERLEYMIKLNDDSVNVDAAITECENKIYTYLGKDWEGRDSGHRIYDATELRELRQRDENGVCRIDSDFRYDYGGTEGYEGKKDNSGNEYSTKSYMDKDNGIYNNVFPYRENEYTAYYPFLMVRGMAVSGGSIATGVLFHYGDWLTKDLWTDKTAAALYEVENQMTEMSSYLTSIQNKDTTGQFKAPINNLKNAIKTINDTIDSASNSPDRNIELTTIRNLLNKWLADSGLIPTLQTMAQEIVDKNSGNTQKQQVAAELLANLKKSEEDLKVLIGRIDAIVNSKA